MNSTGLSDKTITFIRSVMEKYPGVASAVLFGSRAKGSFREASDIDLCLKTTGSFSYDDFLHIHRDFEESLLPYEFDILEYRTLTNSELIRHIDQVGIPLYIRKEHTDV
jgi:predicted nucleotidyltransferase